MEPTERIEVRNIYVSNASLFGALYGLCAGVIVGLFVLIAGLITPSGFKIFGVVYGASVGSLIWVTFLSFVFGFAFVFLFVFFGALIYNFVARMGGKVTLGLAQYVPPKIPVKKAVSDFKTEKKNNSVQSNQVRKSDVNSQSSLKAAGYMDMKRYK